VTTAFSNRYGADALSTITINAVGPQQVTMTYESSRGLHVTRIVRGDDRQASKTYVLGFAQSMPLVIPDTTSLGLSAASLVELRTKGRAPLSLIYDEKLARIDGELRLVAKDLRIPLLIEDQITLVPVVHAFGVFASGEKRASGDFYFLDNRNNPLMVQSAIQLNWEQEQRTERIVRITAGGPLKSQIEQALRTTRQYNLYGLHFDFDKTTLTANSASLIKDIALTLRNNPRWKLQITGHTDSIGEATYNLKLSKERAAAVVEALVSSGIAPGRLNSGGEGESQPKGDNTTLDGRALNRRVELRRTDR
jgi:outer membrane protein OmpA-like peptidoglycan-associated protein